MAAKRWRYHDMRVRRGGEKTGPRKAQEAAQGAHGAARAAAITAPGVVLSGVGYEAGGRRILDAITLELDEHRIGIVGRNGSGKSTLARLICGLIAPTAGTARVGGANMTLDRKRAIATVGILFQNPDHQIIFPTVEEEIAFGLAQQGADKATARRGAQHMLASFDRQDWAERAVHTLSQGQRHMVCLMSVLAMRPALIVMDEPFAGLDIPTTRALNRHIDALDQQLVHITHDPQALANYDRVLWIDAGRIRLDGAAAPVLTAFMAAMEEAGEADERTDLAP